MRLALLALLILSSSVSAEEQKDPILESGWTFTPSSTSEWTYTPAQVEVPARSTFRVNYDPDHQCNRCGSYQYSVSSGRAGVSGHTHTCQSCGNIWWH